MIQFTPQILPLQKEIESTKILKKRSVQTLRQAQGERGRYE